MLATVSRLSRAEEGEHLVVLEEVDDVLEELVGEPRVAVTTVGNPARFRLR